MNDESESVKLFRIKCDEYEARKEIYHRQSDYFSKIKRKQYEELNCTKKIKNPPKSGGKGISFDKNNPYTPYMVQLSVKNKRVYIGRYKSSEEAINARENAITIHKTKSDKDGNISSI